MAALWVLYISSHVYAFQSKAVCCRLDENVINQVVELLLICAVQGNTFIYIQGINAAIFDQKIQEITMIAGSTRSQVSIVTEVALGRTS